MLRPVQVMREKADTMLLVVEDGTVFVADENNVTIFIDSDVHFPFLVGFANRSGKEIRLRQAGILVIRGRVLLPSLVIGIILLMLLHAMPIQGAPIAHFPPPGR